MLAYMLPAFVFAFFTTFAVHLDLTTGKVPNFWIFLFTFAGAHFVTEPTTYFLAFGALAFGYLAYRFGSWAAGDAKFFAVLALWASLFGLPAWFALPLFFTTAGLCGIAAWFKSGNEKYVRLPGTPFLCLAFWALWMVDFFARTIQH